jgi:hypothetical protein
MPFPIVDADAGPDAEVFDEDRVHAVAGGGVVTGFARIDRRILTDKGIGAAEELLLDDDDSPPA